MFVLAGSAVVSLWPPLLVDLHEFGGPAELLSTFCVVEFRNARE